MRVIIDNPEVNTESKIIGQGTYGCVYKPGLIKSTLYYITKIIFDLNSFNEEKHSFQNFSDIIDPTYSFTLEELIFANTSNKEHNEIDVNFLKEQCDVISNTNNLQKAKFINMEYGGETLDSTRNIDTNKLLNFLIGIQKLINYGFVHNDIKGVNILINEEKMSLIDFGLMKHKTQIFRESFHLKFNYIYYPPEYKIIGFLYDFVNLNTKYVDFKYFMIQKYLEVYSDTLTVYLKYYTTKKETFNDHTIFLNEYIKLIDSLVTGGFVNIAKSNNQNTLNEFIDNFFDYTKIDIYSIGVTLIYNGFDVPNMIKSDFRLRDNINTVISNMKLTGGRVSTILPKSSIIKASIAKKQTSIIKKHSSKATKQSSRAKDIEDLINKIKNTPYKISKKNTESLKVSPEERLNNAKEISRILGVNVKFPKNTGILGGKLKNKISKK